MSNEEIKELLRELAAKADAAGEVKSRTVRITLDRDVSEKRPETEKQEKDSGTEEAAGRDKSKEERPKKERKEGTSFFSGLKSRMFRKKEDEVQAEEDESSKDTLISEDREEDLSPETEKQEKEPAKRKNRIGGFFRKKSRVKETEETERSETAADEAEDLPGSEEAPTEEEEAPWEAFSEAEKAGEDSEQAVEEDPEPGEGEPAESRTEDEDGIETETEAEPEKDQNAGKAGPETGLDEQHSAGTGSDEAGAPEYARTGEIEEESAWDEEDSDLAGAAKGKSRKGREKHSVRVTEGDFESDADDFRTLSEDETEESEMSKKIRLWIEDGKEALSRSGFGWKQILLIAAGAAFLLMIFLLGRFLAGNRMKTRNVTADEGLKVSVEKEPREWCRSGEVVLQVSADKPIRSISINGEPVDFEGTERTTLTLETRTQVLDLSVVTEEKTLNAQVGFNYVDTEDPVLDISSENGTVTMNAVDENSGLEGIYVGELTGFSTVPVWWKYSGPFETQKDKLYTYYAKDTAGNMTSRTITDLSPAQEIALSESEITLFPGETIRLTVSKVPEYSFVNDLEVKNSNDSVAQLSDEGVLTARSVGDTVISASARGMAAVKCTVHVKSEAEVTISAVGDITLGEDVNFSPQSSFSTVHAMNGETWFFDKVRSIFEADDVTFGNLEGTLTDRGTRQNKTYAFRGDPSYTNILTDGGVDVVTLANNHSSDYGEISLTDTQEYLDQAGIEWCSGDKIVIKDIDGIKTALIGIYVLDEGKAKVTQVESTIRAAKEQGARIIVMAFHWGSEMATSADKTQRNLAHAAVDYGADLVVGHHPHILQGVEKYKGKYIAYSLGNFCFGGNNSPSDMDTMIFQQTFRVNSSGEVQDGGVNIIPCRISSESTWNNYQPVPAAGEEAERIMTKINDRSSEFGVSF